MSGNRVFTRLNTTMSNMIRRFKQKRQVPQWLQNNMYRQYQVLWLQDYDLNNRKGLLKEPFWQIYGEQAQLVDRDGRPCADDQTTMFEQSYKRRFRAIAPVDGELQMSPVYTGQHHALQWLNQRRQTNYKVGDFQNRTSCRAPKHLLQIADHNHGRDNLRSPLKQLIRQQCKRDDAYVSKTRQSNRNF